MSDDLNQKRTASKATRRTFSQILALVILVVCLAGFAPSVGPYFYGEALAGVQDDTLGLSEERLFSRAARYRAQGNTAFASRLLERAIEIEPNHVASLSLLGSIEFFNGNYRRASHLLGRAVKLDQNNAALMLRYAKSLSRMGKVKKSLATFRLVGEMHPDDPYVQNLRGIEAAENARMAEAEGLFKKTVELDPKSAEAWTNLGVVYAFRVKHDKAIKAFETALSLEPDNVEARYNLIALLKKTDRPYYEVINAHENKERSSKGCGDRESSSAALDEGSVAKYSTRVQRVEEIKREDSNVGRRLFVAKESVSIPKYRATRNHRAKVARKDIRQIPRGRGRSVAGVQATLPGY